MPQRDLCDPHLRRQPLPRAMPFSLLARGYPLSRGQEETSPQARSRWLWLSPPRTLPSRCSSSSDAFQGNVERPGDGLLLGENKCPRFYLGPALAPRGTAICRPAPLPVEPACLLGVSGTHAHTSCAGSPQVSSRGVTRQSSDDRNRGS